MKQMLTPLDASLPSAATSIENTNSVSSTLMMTKESSISEGDMIKKKGSNSLKNGGSKDPV